MEMGNQLEKNNQILQKQLQVIKNSKLSQYYEEVNQKVWLKDINFKSQYHTIYYYDDFFLFQNLSQKELETLKVSKVSIFHGSGWDSIISVQFKYTYTSDDDKLTQIDGFQSRQFEEDDKNIFISMDIDQDDYITEMGYQFGLIVTSIYFITKNGKKLGKQQKNSSDIQKYPYTIFKAPQGYHYTSYRIGLGHLKENKYFLSELGADIKQIPSETIKTISNNTDEKLKEVQKFDILKHLQHQFKSIMDFLSIKDIFQVFKTNKQMSYLRYSDFILNELSRRIIYQGKQSYRTYVQKVMQNSQKPKEEFSTTYKFLDFTENIIKEPKTFKQLSKSGQVQLNDSDGSFSTSYTWGKLTFQKKFSEIFSPQIISEIQQGKIGIVCGASFQTNGPKAELKMEFKILGKNDQILFHKAILPSYILQSSQLQPFEFYYCNNSYINKNQCQFENNAPEQIVFQVAGKDTCSWAGWFGAKISDLYIRLLPIQNDLEEHYFQYVVQKEQQQEKEIDINFDQLQNSEENQVPNNFGNIGGGYARGGLRRIRHNNNPNEDNE